MAEQKESMGAIQAAIEGVKAIAPGLSLEKIASDIAQEAKQQLAHGAHELAAAMFGQSSGFVMYPRAGKENSDQQDNQQGKDVQGPEVQQTPEAPTQERERGGRER